jgi:hypothetical protein
MFEEGDIFHEQDEMEDGYADESITLGQEPSLFIDYGSLSGDIYVSVDGNDDSGDGSQETPFATIQKAIVEAAIDAVIIVSAGDYPESLNFGGKEITVSTSQSATITPQEGTRGVIFNCGETNNSVLKGFTITGGNVGNKIGGGIYISKASPSIEECTIMGNYARQGGGIAILHGSAPTINGCTINGNNSHARGAGLLVIDSNPTFMGEIWVTGNELMRTCPCMRNIEQTRGAGFFFQKATPTFGGIVYVNGNTASESVEDYLTTGEFVLENDALVIDGVLLPSYGGGVYVSKDSDSNITDGKFNFEGGNSATSSGNEDFYREP